MPVDLIISKQFEAHFEAPATVPPEILAKINALAPEPVPADQLYFTWADLANTEYDRSHERFPKFYLDRFDQTIEGKSLLPGHDRAAIPLGLWLSGGVQPTAGAADAYRLKAGFYMPVKSDVATRVRMGIARYVSIGFRAAGRTCDLCGEPYDGVKGCEHVKGQTYDGRLCTVTYSGEPSRVAALEGSLVYWPCQIGAAVTGAKADGLYGGHVLRYEGQGEKDMTKEEEVALQAKIAEQEDEIKRLTPFESRAKDGDAYHGILKGQIARNMAAVAGRPHDEKTPDPEISMLLKTLEPANTETLQAWDKLWQERFDAKFPPSPISKPMGEGEGYSIPIPVTGEQPAVKVFDPFASMKKAF